MQQAGFAASFVSDAQLLLDSCSPLAAISLWRLLSRLVLTMLWQSQSLISYANVTCCCMCYPAQERGDSQSQLVCIGPLSVSLGSKTWTVVHQGVLGSLDTSDGMFPFFLSSLFMVEESGDAGIKKDNVRKAYL